LGVGRGGGGGGGGLADGFFGFCFCFFLGFFCLLRFVCFGLSGIFRYHCRFGGGPSSFHY
jgi:hypothetical protein